MIFPRTAVHGEGKDDRQRHSHTRNVRVLPKSRDFH